MQGAAPPPSDKPGGKAGRPERRVKITRLRARVAERLKGAQNTYAMLTTFNEIDMTNIMQLRKDFKASWLATINCTYLYIHLATQIGELSCLQALLDAIL